MPPAVILDLSRLLSRVFHATPTGVDRVEMAYARGLIATMGEGLSFAAVHPTSLYGRLPRQAVLQFLDRTEERWESQGGRSAWATRRFALEALQALRPRPLPRNAPARRTVYVQASPHHLTSPRLVERILRRERARLVCLVHDLIPLEFPNMPGPTAPPSTASAFRPSSRHSAGISRQFACRPWHRCSPGSTAAGAKPEPSWSRISGTHDAAPPVAPALTGPTSSASAPSSRARTTCSS
jgi:hypothetical protein